MKLGFPLIAWLVHVQVYCSVLSSILQTDMSSVYDAIAEEMLTSLTNSHSFHSNRQKRDLSSGEISLVDDSGVYRLVSIKPVASLCQPAIRTLFLDISNTTYAICVSASTVETPAKVTVGKYREHTWIATDEWYVASPTGVVAFHFENYLYVLVADNEKASGPNLEQINLETGERITDHTVRGSHPIQIAIWKMKINGRYNLATANSAGYKDAANLTTEILIYEWKGTYFDVYASVHAYDVKDIEPFHIHGAAYLAIANFRRGKNIKVDSEILRYDMDRNTWVSHQKIRTYGAMDWESFALGTSLGQEFFLAVANKGDGDSTVKSMIYKFVEDKFVPFQCLPTTKATSFASFAKESAFLLAVANEDDAVHIYQYDGWRFVKSSVQSTTGAMSYGVTHLEFHAVTRKSESVAILSVSNPRHSWYKSVFEIGFRNENALEKWNKKSFNWCSKVLSEIESTDIDKSIGKLDGVIYIDQPEITINGDIIFEKGFVTKTLKTPKLTEISTQEVFDDKLLSELVELQRRLEASRKKLEEFKSILQNALTIEGNQTITGHLQFEDAVFNCKNTCEFGSIYTDVLNGENVVAWKDQLVFLDGEQIINGTLMAKEINASSVHVSGLIDGIDSRNLVTKSGNHVISSHKIFSEPIAARNMQVSGTVDGVVISSSNVLLATGHQTIHGNLSFEHIHTAWLTAGNVNGKNLTEFYSDMVLTDGSYTIIGEKSFHDVAINELVMNPGFTINGVDLIDLWKNALWMNDDQKINAEITFSSVVFEKDLNILHGINGIQIPGPKVVDITEPAVITAPKDFHNSAKINSLKVLKTLNGISLVPGPDESMQLDIMMKSGDQIVTGMKTFHTIHLDADSHVYGTVDGVDLSEFKEMVLRKNTSIVTPGTWTFNNLVVKGPLTAKEVSGIDLKDVYNRALKLSDSEVQEIIFNGYVHANDLQSDDINDINIKSDLVLRGEDQTITGKKTFKEIVLEENSIVAGLINNVNLSIFNDILLRIGNQALKSKSFKRNVTMKDLTVTGSINNVPLTDIVTLAGGRIFGSRALNNVTFTAVEAKNVEVTGTVNGINLQTMIDDTMTYDGHQHVTGLKNVKGTIKIMNDTNLQTRDLNGVNLSELLGDAVLIDVPQEITGHKTFTDNVVFDNLSFDTDIDGVSDWDMRYNWMLKNKPQTVEGNVVFENGLSAKDLKVGLINGIDIKQLESEIVKTNERTEITGPIIFENSIFSHGNVSLTGKIQGIDFSEEAVRRDQIMVTGEKTFTEDLIIEGDLTVDGLIDGIRVEDLCNETMQTNKMINISRLTIKGDVTFLEGGTLGGNLAGVDLKLLEEMAVKKDGSRIKLTGLKRFSNITFKGPVNVKGKFGSVDLKELEDNYMSLTRNQDVVAPMHFDDLKFEGTLSAENLDTQNKEVNNINLQKLNDRVLKTSGAQIVTATYHIDEVTFSDVFVGGTVNGLELPSGLMRRNHTNYIQSPKIFEQALLIFGDLEMGEGSKIQGVHVSEWYRKAVLKDGKFQINGYKTFNKLHLTDVKAEGMFDGLKISEESLLMTYGNQVVSGRKLIEGRTEIEGSLTVNGLINKKDLAYLAKETLQRNRSNTVTGLKYFAQPLTIVSLQAPSVDGINVLELKEKLGTKLNFSLLENKLEEIGGAVSHMQYAFENQAVLLQYYELFDEFDISTAYDWLYVSGEDHGELLMLSDNSSSKAPCSSIRIFGYDKALNRFVPARQELITSYAISVKSLHFRNSTCLFVTNQNPNMPCSDGSDTGKTTIDIYTWNEEYFKKLQSISTHQPTDTVVFQDGPLACFVNLEYNGSVVYCASGRNDFSVQEVLYTSGGRKASVIRSLGKVILAIAAEDISDARQSYMEGQKYIDIYEWNSAEYKFSSPKQSLQSLFTESIALMSHADQYSETLFLVMAEARIPRVHNMPKILVYRYTESSIHPFQKYQEINDYGTLQWLALRTGELIFFAVNSQKGQVSIYQYKGAPGFVKIDTVKSLGTTAAHAFVRTDPADWLNHYLALAGPRALMAQPSQGTDYAKILKSKVKGTRPFY